MYIDGYFPGLGIGIKVSDVSVGPSVIHSNEGCCWRQAEKTHLKIFSYVFNWNTEEKVAMRFKGQKGQDTIHDITLCKYLDPDNELPIDQIIRFLCVAHPV